MNSSKPTYTLSGNGNKNLLAVVYDVYKLRGIRWSIQYIFLSLLSYLLFPFWEIVYQIKYKSFSLSKKTFLFKNKKYFYFFHRYNYTWRCERAIEIPLVRSFLEKYKDKRILELGNVFSHYYSIHQDIVDNYEIAKGVINEDIMKFKPKKKYEMIFSISTLEHIGVDGVKEPGKAIKTITKLKKLLTKNGLLVFTIPLGYNSPLDKALLERKLRLTEVYFFKKISFSNKWVQISEKDTKNAIYGFPYRWGNVVLLGMVHNR